jgi:hypothetical protein
VRNKAHAYPACVGGIERRFTSISELKNNKFALVYPASIDSTVAWPWMVS